MGWGRFAEMIGRSSGNVLDIYFVLRCVLGVFLWFTLKNTLGHNWINVCRYIMYHMYVGAVTSLEWGGGGGAPYSVEACRRAHYRPHSCQKFSLDTGKDITVHIV